MVDRFAMVVVLVVEEILIDSSINSSIRVRSVNVNYIYYYPQYYQIQILIWN